MTYDFESLYSECIGNVFASAKKRFYDNRIKDMSGAFDGGKFVISGNVQGRRLYPCSITFDEAGGLYDYSCDCGAYSMADGPCKHIAALALAYEDKHPQTAAQKSDVRERSDTAVLTLSSEYSKRRRTRYLSASEEKVRLEPILIYNDNDRLSLKFLIGRSKMYLLKDISDFASAVLSAGYRRYGAGLEIDHNIDSFSPQSQGLVKFLVSSYLEKSEILKDMHTASGASRGELMLIANDVDEFLAMYEAQPVRFDDKNIRSGMRIVAAGENSADLKLLIEKVNGGFVVTAGFEPFKTVIGKKFCYYITQTKIHKITREFHTVVSPLIKTLFLQKRLFVSDGDMPLFYNGVITAVGGFLNVDSGGYDISVFEAVPLKVKMFLNGGESGSIEAMLECSYDDEPIDIFNDNLITEIVRDWDTEREFKRVLEKFFPCFPELVLSTDAEVYNLLSVGVGELYNFADIFLEESVRKMKVRKPPRIRVGVRLESELLKIDMSAEEYTFDELKDILSAYREKRNYVRLRDGSFAGLDDRSISALSEILDVTDSNGENFSLRKSYAPYLNVMLKEGFFTLERDAGFKELIKNLTGVSDLDIHVPDNLKSVMRNYQKTGFRWLKTLKDYGFGGILADDMGLGKSLQIIALLESSKENTSIIVCPTTLILNWVNEFEKFAPALKVLAVMGSFDERKEKIETVADYDVVITSYELMRRDEELYCDYKFNIAIIDEAQYIKNPDTRNSKSVKKLNSRYRFALTGTPVENSLAELWSIFDFIMPGYLYSYERFKDKFEAFIVAGDETAAAKLRKFVAPFILRRLKSEVLKELPPKTETDISAALEGEQRDLYFANLALIRDSVREKGESVNKIVVLSMLTKLRQICCEPRLAYPDYEGNSAKLDTCLELITQAAESGHKVLLFSQFTSMLEIIRRRIMDAGLTYYLLKGDTPKSERIRLVNNFNVNDTNVFLISLKAGGTGLNLTGADVVIHYDPWWNESVMNQATDRAYRMGQDKPVQVYKLIMKDTIEQRILKLQEKKTALSSLIVGKGETHSGLSYEDILTILEE